MIKFILFALLILQRTKAQQFLSEISSDVTYSYQEVLRCFLQQGVIKGSLMMGLGVFQFDYYWASTYNQTEPKVIYEIYPQPFHVIIFTFQSFDHSLYGELVAKALKDLPIQAVWVQVSFKISCAQLKGFLRDARNAVGPDITIGVVTDSQSWNQSFDTRQGCPQVPQYYPLIDFEPKFYPFGGWKKTEYIRDSKSQVPQCSAPEHQTYVISYAKPKTMILSHQ